MEPVPLVPPALARGFFTTGQPVGFLEDHALDGLKPQTTLSWWLSPEAGGHGVSRATGPSESSSEDPSLPLPASGCPQPLAFRSL